jgi:hypothetical protein
MVHPPKLSLDKTNHAPPEMGCHIASSLDSIIQLLDPVTLASGQQ